MEKELLAATGDKQGQEPRSRGVDPVLVRNIAGTLQEGASRRGYQSFAQAEREFAIEHVERFVLPKMDMQRWRGALRQHGLPYRQRPSGIGCQRLEEMQSVRPGGTAAVGWNGKGLCHLAALTVLDSTISAVNKCGPSQGCRTHRRARLDTRQPPDAGQTVEAATWWPSPRSSPWKRF
jgi:hypothetical protein